MSTGLPHDDAADERSLAQAWRTLSVVSLASVVSAFNGTALNVALPTLTEEFGATATASTLVLIGFQFTMTALMLLFGRLADIRGRRAMYLTGLAVFGTVSLALGFAPTIEVVIGLRVLQAVGAAMLLANSAALVSDAFPRERLGQGMGFYIASFSIASLIAPVAGGLLVDTWGWRWLFWLNVPFCLVCFLWAWIALPAGTRVRGASPRLDLVGNLLSLVSLGALLWSLGQVTGSGWANPVVIGGLVAFALLTPVFVWWELRYPEPLLDITLFHDRSFGIGLLGTLLNAVARFPPALLLPLYLQAVGGLTAAEAGLLVLPFVIGSLVGSIGYGLISGVASARVVSRISASAATVGLVVLALTAGAREVTPALLAGQVLVGIGSGAFLPANTTIMLEGLHSDRLGVANGLRLVVMNVGGTLGTALSVSLVVMFLAPDLASQVMAGTIADTSPAAMPDLVDGFRLAYGTAAVLSFVGAFATFFDTPKARHTQDAGPPSLQWVSGGSRARASQRS